MCLKAKEVISTGGGYGCRPKENKKDKPKNNTDKPFCLVLDEVIKKAYPNVRTYEKEKNS